MSLTPEHQAVEAARREFDGAYFGGASQDAINAAARDLGAAKEAVETIDQRCLRLGLNAADKDAEAERHMAAEADAAGRAAGRRLAGHDDALAASFDREAAVCRGLALNASAEAERLRSQAASLRRAQSYAADVVASLHAAQ